MSERRGARTVQSDAFRGRERPMRTDLTLETPAVTAVTPERGVVRSWLTWRGLAVVAAIGDLGMLALLSVTAPVRFALGLMVPSLLGVGLFRFQGGTVGRVVLG